MELLSAGLHCISNGCKFIVNEPEITKHMVDVAHAYQGSLNKWRFVKRVLDAIFAILCCIGMLIFSRVIKDHSFYDNVDSVIYCIIVGVLACIVLSTRVFIDNEERRCVQQLVREAIFTVFRVSAVRLRRRNKQLNALMGQAQEVADRIDTVFTILAPIVAICAPGWHAWWRLGFSISLVNKKFDKVSSMCNSLYQFLRFSVVYSFFVCTQFYKCNKWSTRTFVAAIAVVAAWKASRSISKGSSVVPTKVVPRKRQEIVDDASDCPPAHVCNQLAEIPGSPRFKGCELVSQSLVRVKASYIATAFRSGNSLVTAIHCLGKKTPTSQELGVWAENPEDKKYYWAPLEEQFLNQHIGDGVAICSLPNAPFFASLKSCSLGAHKSTEHVATFTCDCGSKSPIWNWSTGESFLDTSNGLCYMYSTVKPGSSGGPIVNADGSVVAIVYAETYINGEPVNIGITISDEVRSFLVNGGAVKPSTSVNLQKDQSATESTETTESEGSYLRPTRISSDNIPGPIRESLMRSKRSKNSHGPQKRQPKNKKKEQSPPLQPEQEHPVS